MRVERIIAAEAVTRTPSEDQAVSRSLLERTAAGELDGALRIWRPSPALALTRLDSRHPGADRAVALARAAGVPVGERASGGHAVVTGPGSLAVGVAERAATFEGTSERYGRLGNAIVAALATVGIDADQGALPDEWCPGPWSVRAGAFKLAGLAQRAIKGAGWVEAVIPLDPDPLARELMPQVYAALELPLDVRTLGSVSEAARRNVAFDELAQALAAAIDREWQPAWLGN